MHIKTELSQITSNSLRVQKTLDTTTPTMHLYLQNMSSTMNVCILPIPGCLLTCHLKRLGLKIIIFVVIVSHMSKFITNTEGMTDWYLSVDILISTLINFRDYYPFQAVVTTAFLVCSGSFFVFLKKVQQMSMFACYFPTMQRSCFYSLGVKEELPLQCKHCILQHFSQNCG